MNEINTKAEHVRDPIHENCNGCSKVLENSTCSAYIKPESWWRRGGCALADHIKVKEINNGVKTRVGQQKQSKNKIRGKK